MSVLTAIITLNCAILSTKEITEINGSSLQISTDTKMASSSLSSPCRLIGSSYSNKPHWHRCSTERGLETIAPTKIRGRDKYSHQRENALLHHWCAARNLNEQIGVIRLDGMFSLQLKDLHNNVDIQLCVEFCDCGSGR